MMLLQGDTGLQKDDPKSSAMLGSTSLGTVPCSIQQQIGCELACSSTTAEVALTELSPVAWRISAQKSPKVLIIDLGRAFFIGDDQGIAQAEMDRLDRLLRAAS